MRALFPPRALLQNPKLLSVVAANAIPAIGVLTFGTSAAALLAFYWLELGVLAVWALVRALFAGHRAERTSGPNALRGTAGAVVTLVFSRLSEEGSDSSDSDGGLLDKRVTLPRSDIGVYVGTVPALLFIGPLLAAVWVGFGGFVAGPVLAATDATTLPNWVIIGAGVVFLSEGARTVVEYFYRGTHRETSPWMAARGIFWQGFALAGAGLFVVVFAYESTEGRPVSTERAARGPLVFTAIAAKFLIDITRYYVNSREIPLRERL